MNKILILLALVAGTAHAQVDMWWDRVEREKKVEQPQQPQKARRMWQEDKDTLRADTPSQYDRGYYRPSRRQTLRDLIDEY